MATKASVIWRTEDYNTFKRIDGNRIVNKSHVKRLKTAISENPDSVQYTPIVVNEKKQIVDGQHRLEALQELKLPVYFIEAEGLTLADVQKLNSNSKSWSPLDYAYSWSELGKTAYDFYLELRHRFGLNHDVLMKFVSLDKPITGIGFQNGKLKAPDTKRSIDLCEKLADVGQYHEHYKKRPFALAFKVVWEHPNYDHARMIAKLQAHVGKDLDDLAQVEDNIRALEKLYNRNVRTEERVRFF